MTPIRSRNGKGKKTTPAGGTSPGPSPGPPASSLLGLQRTAGNAAVERLMRSGLEVSRPGDAREQEAERMAEQALAPRPAEIDDVGVQPPERPGEAPPEAADLLTGMGPGRPLDAASRALLEPGFGQDLGHVRVHTGPAAAEAVEAARARAFTVGRDVVFGAGEYAPGTAEGSRLLAHEVAHVVQRPAAGSPPILQRSPFDVARPAPAQEAPLAVVELGATELITEKNPALEQFAKSVMDTLRLFPTGTVQVTGYWDSSGDSSRDSSGDANVPSKDTGFQRSDAEQRAKLAKTALAALGIPPAKIVTGALDRRLLSDPRATPAGMVRIAFHPQGLELPKLGQVRPVPPPRPPGGPKPGLPLNPRRPSPAPAPPAGGPEKEVESRKGTPGDLVKAFLALDPVKQAIDRFVETQKQNFKDMPAAGKAATIVGAAALGAGAVAGIASDADARKMALDSLHGAEVPLPLPGVPGRFSVQILTKKDLPEGDPRELPPPKVGKPVGAGAILKFKIEF